MERVKLRHKQVRNVLPTDSLEQLDEDLNGVAKALKPENRIIQIYSDDYAYSSAKRIASTVPLLKLVTALKPGNGINGHFSCIVAEKHMAQPLPVAANLWAKTHEFASAAPNADGERAQPAQISGQHFSNGAGAAGWSQNDETKPIVRPEAG